MAREPKKTTPADAKAPTEAQQRASLRSQAERIVLDRHRDEFYVEAERLFTENGLKFNRRLTPQERAEREMQQILSEFPALAAKIAKEGSLADEA